MKKTSILVLFAVSAPWAYGDYTVEFGPKLLSMDTNAKSSEFWTVYNPFLDEELPYGWYGTTKGEMDRRSLAATAYFGRVKDSGVPLAEAGFLSKLSRFSIDVGTEKSESFSTDRLFNSDDLRTYSGKEDGAFLDTDLQMVTPGIPVILGGGLGFESYDSEFSDEFGVEKTDIDVRTYRLHAGFYYNDRGSILYTYENRETDRDADLYLATDTDTTTHRVSARQLFQLPASQNLALNADYQESKVQIDGWSGDFESEFWQVGVDYYPMANLQLGISASENRWDDNDTEKGLSYSLKFFFTPLVSVEVALADFESSAKIPADGYRASSRDDVFEFAVAIRF